MQSLIIILIVCLQYAVSCFPPKAHAQLPFANSQSVFKFDELFFLAKDYLAKGKINKARPLFEKMAAMDSANANILYLTGVCHTLDSVPDTVAIPYLEKGIPSISDTYDPGSPHEKHTPIFVYYYLTIAYSENNRCEDALQASKKFQKLYGIFKDDYYSRDTRFWVDSCAKKTGYKPGLPEPGYHKIITQLVDYSTPSPLYGVQVGAYSKFVPVWEFDNLKNVDAFMDNNGMLRYVIGHFALRTQAETLKKTVMEKGYNDAFVVDVNKEKKFTDQIISVDDQSVNKTLRGKVDFRVQVGAFRDSIPVKLVELYMKIDGIKENREAALTVLTAGSFDLYDDAKNYQNELIALGIDDAFLVAYNQDRKVPLKQAMHYAKKKKAEKTENDNKK